MSRTANPKLLAEAMGHFTAHLNLPDPGYALVAALWSLMTYLWFDCFDVLPYLCIKSATKRSGKTLFAEHLKAIVSNPADASGMTASVMYRTLTESRCTMISDEAEIFHGEGATNIRTALNIGYKRGQKIMRTVGNKVVEFETFGPKVFILIGDIYDTLRDRSILFTMVRRPAPAPTNYPVMEREGHAIGERLKDWAETHKLAVREAYDDLVNHPLTYFANPRDAEIWTSLFALVRMIDPKMEEELTRVAVDLSTDKTVPAQEYNKMKDKEDEAERMQYGEMLLKQMVPLFRGQPTMYTSDMLKALQDIPTGPWRRVFGEGLNENNMPRLLERFNLKPRYVKIKGHVKRGYYLKDVQRAMKLLGDPTAA